MLELCTRGSGWKKKVIKDLHKFGATCSYEETKVFKRSAAVAALKDLQYRRTFDSDHGMIQTHGLATPYLG